MSQMPLDTSTYPQDVEVHRQAAELERTFMAKVYAWMTGGLLTTAVVALLTASSPTMVNYIVNSSLFWVLLIAELLLVIGLSAMIEKISPAVATGAFLLYSAVSGLTLSIVFLMYTQASIASTFFVTAGTFGAMSAYGYLTKRDLSGWGSFLYMGLIGLIIASVVNIFLHNEMVYWVVTYAGILIFVGLTAYDTQKIKQFAAQGASHADAHKAAIMGALKLYLDFINLFLLLLRLLGRRR